MSNIGMMDQAYFVGRREILDWINDFLGTNVQKIEQTASGAIACQLLDSLHPGQVPMSKVNWDAKNDYEFVDNYKILQRAFDKIGIDKHVDVQKLCHARYQDNLEFMQWFKRYFELNQPAEGYDPIAQRKKGKGGSRYKFGGGVAKKPQGGSRASAGRSAGRGRGAAAAGRGRRQARQPDSGPAGSQASRKSNSEASMKVAQLEEEKDELNGIIDSLTEEREFYFEKLREIEILLQTQVDDGKDSPLIQAIFKILYATNEEDGAEGGDAEGGDAEGVPAPDNEVDNDEDGLPPDPPHAADDAAIDDLQQDLKQQEIHDGHEETY